MASLLLPVIYLAFISLGLPDSLLGSAWPSMYTELGASLSWAGIVSMIISAGTIVSSLASERLNRRLGTGGVTALSVLLTAAALLGFSLSGSFWQLCLWAVPYGLGAGSVDAALNNYVALHYESRHMSWLHCMWGIGAAAGPSLIGLALTRGQSWQGGYRIVSVLQIALTAVLLLSLPLWKRSGQPGAEADAGAGLAGAGRFCAGGPGLCAHLPQHHPCHAGAFRPGPLPGDDRGADGQRLCGHLPDAAALRPAGQPPFGRAAAALPAGAAGPDDRHP